MGDLGQRRVAGRRVAVSRVAGRRSLAPGRDQQKARDNHRVKSKLDPKGLHLCFSPLPPIRHELHFGDRLVRCFEERPSSVWAMFAAALAQNPDGIALIDAHRRLTYAALGAEVEQVAAGRPFAGAKNARLAVLQAASRLPILGA